MQPTNNFDVILKTIDDATDFDIIMYSRTETNEESFYLLEQSSLQVLRELPPDYRIQVHEIFSQRHRVAQKIELLKTSQTIHQFLQIVLPLVENASFPCDNLTLTINDSIKLEAHDDGEVTLTSKEHAFLRYLVKTILIHQGFNQSIFDEIIQRPDLYHKLERPDIIKYRQDFLNEILELEKWMPKPSNDDTQANSISRSLDYSILA